MKMQLSPCATSGVGLIEPTKSGSSVGVVLVHLHNAKQRGAPLFNPLIRFRHGTISAELASAIGNLPMVLFNVSFNVMSSRAEPGTLLGMIRST